MCESILGLAMPLKLYFSFFLNWTRDFIFYLFTHPCVFSVVPSCFAERFSRNLLGRKLACKAGGGHLLQHPGCWQEACVLRPGSDFARDC